MRRQASRFAGRSGHDGRRMSATRTYMGGALVVGAMEGLAPRGIVAMLAPQVRDATPDVAGRLWLAH